MKTWWFKVHVRTLQLIHKHGSTLALRTVRGGHSSSPEEEAGMSTVDVIRVGGQGQKHPAHRPRVLPYLHPGFLFWLKQNFGLQFSHLLNGGEPHRPLQVIGGRTVKTVEVGRNHLTTATLDSPLTPCAYTTYTDIYTPRLIRQRP